MKRFSRATILLLSLLLILLLSGCVVREVVVVVTATPDPAAPAAAPTAEATPEPEEEEGTTAAPSPAQPTPSSDEGLAGLPDPALSPPDAAVGRIAYMGPMGNNGPIQAFVVNADGTGLTSVSETQGDGWFPSLSPDGNRVAFMAGAGGEPDIFVTDLLTGEATNLTNDASFDTQPVWSPDGQTIAFVSDREGSEADLWGMDADGSNLRRLARTPGLDNLGSWSPDGKQIVFSSEDEEGESLWILDVASGEVTALTESNGGTDSAPAWSPDGELIAFYSASQSTPAQLFTIRPDGSDRRQITSGNQSSLVPVWSPDGEWLLYTIFLSQDRYDMVALNVERNEVSLIPNVQGFATSWAAADELLADTGFTQGPKQSGVEVSPEVLERAYRKGSPDAPVTIVEFSDFQCPFCRRWTVETLPQLEPYIEDGTVQLIYVDFPLNIHPQAPAAAEAAHCARELGGDEAAWTMHDALFEGLDRWNNQSAPLPIFKELADQAGLDGAAIEACVESGRYKEVVDAAMQEGFRLGISGTPTFFINGNRLVGAQPFDAFKPYLP